MPKRIPEFFVIDILISLDKVKRYTKNFLSLEEFVIDEKTFDATVRELEIIGEALKHILSHSAYDYLVKHQWRIIVDFRNIVAHEYFGIDYDEIFDIVRNDLLEFEHEFLEFAQVVKSTELISALNFAKQELTKIKRYESINYLEYLESLLNDSNKD
ncbi:DUF86 domain-containing protein [Candidatus Dependentiae bacterium]|nr:DUF86 domain-containing protein [Candidatus Dependentiae bacterium]